MTTRNIPDWVRVGQEVVISTIVWGDPSYSSILTIEKVYKTGNFTVAGQNDRQWRPVSDWAWLAGRDNSWSRERLLPLTDALKAEMKAAQRYSTAKRLLHNEAERLEKLARSDDREAIIAAAAALKARES